MEPRLYIVMREDLWDMNPGKGLAQAAHAQADFDTYVQNHYTDFTDSEFHTAHVQWCEDRNFGVTLVLSAPLNDMHEIRTRVKYSDITVDPTYPYRNWYGKLFVREEPTCMWAFVWKDEDIEYMKQWELHE